jgi:hypothetical protein
VPPPYTRLLLFCARSLASERAASICVGDFPGEAPQKTQTTGFLFEISCESGDVPREDLSGCVAPSVGVPVFVGVVKLERDAMVLVTVAADLSQGVVPQFENTFASCCCCAMTWMSRSKSNI